jgi:hypothetical protein
MMLRHIAVVFSLSTVIAAPVLAKQSNTSHPGCEDVDARQCLQLAIAAIGGERLTALKGWSADVVSHTLAMEQSYRQAPFTTSYARSKIVVDFAGQRIRKATHAVWPESGTGDPEYDTTLVVTPEGGVRHIGENSGPGSASDIEWARQTLALDPARVLLTAAAASDLRFEAPRIVHATPHTVLAFTWNQIPVSVLINPYNHFPDAVDTTQRLHDFWRYWGDVSQRVYFENWQPYQGVRYPTNQIIERNGAVWSSLDLLHWRADPAIEPADFAVDAKLAQASLANMDKATTFSGEHGKELAPGILFYEGPWNATIVKQDDGVVLLETPLSGAYTAGLYAQAAKLYPQARIKAVLSTSDSWPHVGGVRYDVAQGAAVYILDLNQPLLDRLVAAPHALDPDELQKSRKAPQWKLVTGKTTVGSGANRAELYPLRGVSTERQYMVYFPEHRLLYASDTLVVNDDGTPSDLELMSEVEEAVNREHLDVDKVFAMHQAPIAWTDVTAMLRKAGV